MIENWVVPCNTKYYDVVKHLNEKDYIVWRKVSAIHKGDIVYLYIALPYQEIKFRCVVIDDDLDEKTVGENSYAIKNTNNGKKSHYLLLKKEYAYEDGTLRLADLKANGLGQTQTQARTDRKLQSYIDRVNETIIK